MIDQWMDTAQRIIWQWGVPIAFVAVALLLVIKLLRRVPGRVLLNVALLIGGGVAGAMLSEGPKGNDDPSAGLPDMARDLAIELAPPATVTPAPKPPKPTNALCGRCGGTFWASWAPTCRCPHCGYSMNASMAKREHGPEYRSFSIR